MCRIIDCRYHHFQTSHKIRSSGEVLKPPFEISHTVDELEHLIILIKSFDEEARVVLEDTGHYHLPVVTAL
ncbi:MAG: IS110 family transposase, partial [Ruminococcus sp.]|nr:IS110 family transposase [Ruminococcus sp.]